MEYLHPELVIDLDNIVASKFPNNKIPKWFIAWMKRFVHQDFLNELIDKGYEGVEFCTGSIKHFDVTLQVEGLENVKVPEGARLTFAGNHPLGGMDGIGLLSVIGTRFGPNLRILVNDFLMYLKGLAPLCYGVNKTGAQSRRLSSDIKEMFESENNVVVFPAGICSRRIKGKITDPQWTKNFVKMSRRTGRWIVPVHFIGRNSNRFYNIAGLCKFLGLKFNFAMLFLPDEMYRIRHKTFKIVFGKPIPPETFDSSRTDIEWAEYVREEVYKL